MMSPSDAQLLERFAASRDEAAFESLLARHGPMVWGVCLRALGHRQEAEDAFQATFLVLARRAAAIRQRDAVGGWLYSVARRLAIRVKSAGQARREREKSVGEQAAAVRGPDDLLTHVVWREVRSVLDDELNHLPRKYRAPIVLCYLEGKTHLEAAQELGWPSGSISKRLARACELLRERLMRRGLAFSTTLVAGALTEHGAAAVPPALATATLRSALACISGKMAATVAPPVLALTEGVLTAMFLTKLKIAAAVLVAVGLSVSLAAFGARAGGQDPLPGSVPIPKDPLPAAPAGVTQAFDKADQADKKDMAGAFVTQVIDPQPRHTLTLPANYGCILVLRERPIRWEWGTRSSDTAIGSFQPIGKGKQFLLRTGPGLGTAVCHFWFDNPQSWNYQESLFTLAIRIETEPVTTKPIDPATYRDIPLITSIIPPQGEVTMHRGATRLLVLKEAVSRYEPARSRLLNLKLVAPKQLLITAVPSAEFGAGSRIPGGSFTQVLSFWFPANPDPEQVEVVNYLVHVTDDGKEAKVTSNNISLPGAAGEAPGSGPLPPLTALAKAKRDAAKAALEARRKEIEAGRATQQSTLESAKRLLEADLELAGSALERIKAYEEYLQLTKTNEANANKQFEAGQIPLAALCDAKYLRAEAELWLAKEMGKP